VSAIHSASDILATGATVTEALANVVVPEGDSSAQQRLLSDFLAGARHEFDLLGARVVGGHTIVGPRMEMGFTVIGRPLGETLLQKNGLRVGDYLFLTKPLGVGVLLAAHMRSECRANDYQQLIATMLQSQAAYAQLAISLGLIACTDITGFGLAGHLLEMLSASQVGATVRLADLPLLSGAVRAVTSGIESSLFADNRQCESQLATEPAIRDSARYRLLFDPQTCGGFLLGVPSPREPEFLAAVSQAKLPIPSCIGQVTSDNPGRFLVT
jgi:selenide,water dikinase